MWTYICRRLLLMIPTLFGVTVVSFCIMQLAPGDPLMNQVGQGGATGSSSQTREAYLIQKRDLQLDKPLLLNFNYFRDFSSQVRVAAHYSALSTGQIQAELPKLAEPAGDPVVLQRLKFLKKLKIDAFAERLHDPEQYAGLAQAIQAYVQIYCEDIGTHGVPAAIAVLEDPQTGRELQIGTVRALNSMVVEPFRYTYSRVPRESETPLVLSAWKLWWERKGDQLPAIDPDRKAILQDKLSQMAVESSRGVIFEWIESLDRDDMRFFADVLLGDSSLAEKAIAATTLRLYIGNPLRVDVAIDAPQAEVDDVRQNWLAHFSSRQAEYQPSFPRRVLLLFGDTQYAHMVWRLATFNFGRSALRTREPVSEKIWAAVKVSAPLMLLSQVVIYLVAVPLGVACAVRRGKLTDRLISFVLFVLYSIPPFVAAMLFLLFFCYGTYLKWFPTLGLHSDGADHLGWVAYLLDYGWHATLPVTCLALFSLAGLAMYARSSMLDVIEQDYIRTARAKGVAEWKVILKHALRNSLIPIITLFANFLPAMLGGSVLIEVLFGIPGMGRLSWVSIEQKDFPTLMALVYIDAIVVMISILLSDLLYVLVDPRISFSGRGEN